MLDGTDRDGLESDSFNINLKGLLIGVGVLVLSASILSFISISDEVEKNYAFSDSSLFLEAGSGNRETQNSYRFVNNNTLLAQSTPSVRPPQVLGADIGEAGRQSIISYQVESGDSLESISSEFDISVDTIKWANSISGSSVSAGDELLILPTTGVLYYVKQGESLSDIATKHNADMEDIVDFNNDLESLNDTIRPGDQLIIPDGEKPAATPERRAPQVTHTGFAAVTYGTVTQGMHSGHKAIDVANNCGTPIYSGGSGTVTRTGSDPARAGNYIWIDHGGFKALYAHLHGIHVSAGQRVAGGQQIGTMGNTGYTLGATGCHIHFETRGGANPFRYMQRGHTMQ